MEENLRILFHILNDHYKDAKMLFNYAKEVKGSGDKEMVKYLIDNATIRLSYFKEVKQKIDYLLKGADMQNPYYLFYDNFIKNADELYKEISDFSKMN